MQQVSYRRTDNNLIFYRKEGDQNIHMDENKGFQFAAEEYTLTYLEVLNTLNYSGW